MTVFVEFADYENEEVLETHPSFDPPLPRRDELVEIDGETWFVYFVFHPNPGRRALVGLETRSHREDRLDLGITWR